VLVILTEQRLEHTLSTLEQSVPGGSSSEGDAMGGDVCTGELEKDWRQ
jgi:hypothetical protein